MLFFTTFKKFPKKVKILFLLSLFIVYSLATKFYVHVIPLFDYYLPWFPKKPMYFYNDYKLSSFIIAFIWFIWLVYIYTKIKQEKKKKLQIRLAVIWLIISILSHVLFYVTNPKYVYNFHPKWFLYTDITGEYITNKDRYFWLLDTYWKGIGGSYAKFKTFEDSIEALEFAKRQNDDWIYYAVFLSMERFWYDKSLEKYRDATFQIFFIRKLLYTTSISEDDRKVLI